LGLLLFGRYQTLIFHFDSQLLFIWFPFKIRYEINKFGQSGALAENDVPVRTGAGLLLLKGIVLSVFVPVIPLSFNHIKVLREGT
jgi:hypothetical protein